MNSNPLHPIWEKYKMTIDGLKVVKRAVKTKNSMDRQRLLQRTFIFEQDPNVINVDNIANAAEIEVDELFVVSFWAFFERNLRRYLQKKGILLKGIIPTDLGESIYNHFFDEVEYWKPDDILDFLKQNLLKDKPQLAGDAKAVYRYRSWIVHGKSEDAKDKVTPIPPKTIYMTLSQITQILLANLSEPTITAIFEKGVFRPISFDKTIYEGQQVQLIILE